MNARVWAATAWVPILVLAMLALSNQFMPAALIVQIILLVSQLVAMFIAIRADLSPWSA